MHVIDLSIPVRDGEGRLGLEVRFDTPYRFEDCGWQGSTVSMFCHYDPPPSSSSPTTGRTRGSAVTPSRNGAVTCDRATSRSFVPVGPTGAGASRPSGAKARTSARTGRGGLSSGE